jgi:hypothetical protein
VLELPWYLRPVRTAVEEGTELGGMLVLIYTTLPNSRDRIFTSVTRIRWGFALFASAVAWPLAELTAAMDEQAALGHLSDWLSCVLFTSSAAMLVANWAQSNPRESFPSTAVVLLCAASALCVQFDPVGDHELFPASSTIRVLGADLNTRLVLLALCCLGTAEALRGKGRSYRSGALLVAGIGLVAAGFAIFSTEDVLWWGYFATSLVAVGTFAAVATALPHIHAMPAAQPAPEIAR